jgi:hypothetical protein
MMIVTSPALAGGVGWGSRDRADSDIGRQGVQQQCVPGGFWPT